MNWILIRHGQTSGNLEGRYIGCRSDEPLCAQGIAALRARQYPPVSRVFVSPMKRCIRTAEIIYPDVPMQIVHDLRECDFGEFENRNYAELNGRADYQAWIDSRGEMPFPNGESRTEFAARCLRAFESIRKSAPPENCALIVHGGTIMAIMEKYAADEKSYYDFQVKNAEGFVLRGDGSYERL